MKTNVSNQNQNPGLENPKHEIKAQSATSKKAETIYTLKLTNYARG